jgi:hypothetical protein
MPRPVPAPDPGRLSGDDLARLGESATGRDEDPTGRSCCSPRPSVTTGTVQLIQELEDGTRALPDAP